MQYNNDRLSVNNFDLLRLVFATMVLLAHAAYLSGFKELLAIYKALPPHWAVKAFFVVSGFLIFMSYERSSSNSSYASKRARRIYPAYFSVIALFAFLCVLVSSKSLEDYFSADWLKYVIANLAFLNFLQPSLPGVFENHISSAVNGALWTLKIEVMFYITVPFFVFLFRRFNCLLIIIIFYCLSITYSLLFSYIAKHTDHSIYILLGQQLPGQLSYFMGGAFFYYFVHFFERYVYYFVSIALLVLVGNLFFSLSAFVPFALATIVVFFGLFFYAGNFGKYGDFSYGIYILHYPIVQILLHVGWFRDSAWLFLASVILISALSAVALWHFIEKRFLLRSSHYVIGKDLLTKPL